MGAWYMLLFGIPFVGMMIHRIYVFSQIAKKEETHIRTPFADNDSIEHPDKKPNQQAGSFCPHCGGALQESFSYCPKCGRRLQSFN